MKKIVPLSFIASVLFGTNALAADNDRSVKFVLNASPAAFAVMPNLEDFVVDNGLIFESIDGTTAWTPNINVGANIKISNPVSLEATVGTGKLISDAFDSSFTTERIGINFKLGSVVTLGVQGGRIDFKQFEWEGVNDVKIDDPKGRLMGLSLTVGGDLFSFYISAEKMDIDKVDVTAPAGSVASSSTLDISGSMANIGVKMMF